MLLKTARKCVVAIIGGTLLIVGIVGWLMPVLPGWPLFFVALAILGTEFVWAKRFLKRMKEKAQWVASSLGLPVAPANPQPPPPGPAVPRENQPHAPAGH